MSTAEFAQRVYSMVSSELQSRPMVVDFEMAYQARVASDRIRFVIRQLEASSTHSDDLQEAGMQLLDALDRLETADRTFQRLCRSCADMTSDGGWRRRDGSGSNGTGGHA